MKTRTVHQIIRFVRSPRTGARYIGWLGHDNLGDDALYEAVQEYFQPVSLAYLRAIHQPAVASIVSLKRHEASILGGGTLIGGVYRTYFEKSLSRTGRGIVFGSGVANPAFWSMYPESSVSISAWGPVLEQCEYVGVRGPDSANTLADIGIGADILGDPAAFFVRRPGWWDPKDRVLGINVGQAGGRMWGSEQILVERVGALIRRAAAEGWRVEFFVVWPSDLEVVAATIQEAGIGDTPVHRIYNRPDKFVETVRHVTVFVGMKLHSVVLAMCAGVPSIMLEYRPKCLDFMKSVSLEHLSVRVDRLDADEQYEQVVNLLHDADDASTDVTSRMQQLKDLQCVRASVLASSFPFP